MLSDEQKFGDYRLDPGKTHNASDDGQEFGDTLNTSGIKPWEYKVLVRPDIVPEQSKGGILYSEHVRSQMQMAICKGVIVDMSRLAFNYDVDMTTVIPASERPRIGMRVLFAKYAGGEIPGEDGITYRMINDKDVLGEIVSEKPEFEEPSVPLIFAGSAK